MMMVQYLLDADAQAVVPGVSAPQVAFTDIVAPVALALAQEKQVTDQINALAAHARSESDYTSEQFLQWFIKEQVEEVATMSDLLRVVERSSDDPMEIENWLAREQPGGEERRPDRPSRRGRRRVALAHAAVAHLERARAADRLQEPAVVRHRDDRRRRLGERALQDLERVEVEVVGRLVEQQQVGAGGDDRRDRGARALAGAEALERPAHRGLAEPEVRQQRARLALVDAAAGVAAEPRQQRAAVAASSCGRWGSSRTSAATSTSPALGASVPSSSDSSVRLAGAVGAGDAIRSPP